METKFESLDEILKKANQIGYPTVLSSLKEERSNLHPDKNGGLFLSETVEQRYHFLDTAISEIELKTEQNKQLISIDQLPALVESISKSIALQNKPNSLEIEKNYKESFRSDLSRKYKGAKVGSGIFAAITGFLFTQSQSLIDHPLVGVFFKSTFGNEVLAVIFLSSILLFVITWLKERREESLSNYLLSEEALRNIYHIIKDRSEGGEIETNVIRQGIRESYGSRNTHPMNIYIGSRLSAEILDKILNVQLERLIDRKVIQVVERASIERVYRILV